MPEPVDAWWARRRFSRGAQVPYPVGAYREVWQQYPVLVRQYHPELNHGITLTQVPPAADVWLQWECDTGHRFIATPTEQRMRPGTSRRRSTWCPECFAGSGAGPVRERRRRMCERSPAHRHAPGEPFVSPCAPRPASASEPRLRQLLAQRIEFDGGYTAVRLRQPFFDHVEAWPDILLPDLRVAIEFDTIGRDGLEHLGRREAGDRRKDQLLRHAGWEVVRLRIGKLQPLGPFDVVAGGVTARAVDRIVDALRDIRGPLFVDAYLR